MDSSRVGEGAPAHRVDGANAEEVPLARLEPLDGVLLRADDADCLPTSDKPEPKLKLEVKVPYVVVLHCVSFMWGPADEERILTTFNGEGRPWFQRRAPHRKGARDLRARQKFLKAIDY
jgi:hypothetical protein